MGLTCLDLGLTFPRTGACSGPGGPDTTQQALGGESGRGPGSRRRGREGFCLTHHRCQASKGHPALPGASLGLTEVLQGTQRACQSELGVPAGPAWLSPGALLPPAQMLPHLPTFLVSLTLRFSGGPALPTATPQPALRAAGTTSLCVCPVTAGAVPAIDSHHAWACQPPCPRPPRSPGQDPCMSYGPGLSQGEGPESGEHVA